MIVRVTAIGGDVSNVRAWMGTRDDWIGTTDGPQKQIGDFNEEGVFEVGRENGGRTIKISSGDEGVFFTSPIGKAVQASCCSFENSINIDPDTAAIDTSGDGSYGIFFSLGDITEGTTGVAIAAYAAGPLA